jgi:hypothetical protein
MVHYRDSAARHLSQVPPALNSKSKEYMIDDKKQDGKAIGQKSAQQMPKSRPVKIVSLLF